MTQISTSAMEYRLVAMGIYDYQNALLNYTKQNYFGKSSSFSHRTNGRMNEWMNGRTDERMNGRMDEWTNGRMDKKDEWMYGRMDEWTNG